MLKKNKKNNGIVQGCSEWLSGCCYAVARRLLDLLLTSLYFILVLGPSMKVYVIYWPPFRLRKK